MKVWPSEFDVSYSFIEKLMWVWLKFPMSLMFVFSFPTISCLAAVPTSFEGPFGKIVYRVKVTIDTPRFSKDYKIQKPFYLLNMLNLNEVPDIAVSAWFTFVFLHFDLTFILFDSCPVHLGLDWKECCNAFLYLINFYLCRSLFDFVAEQERVLSLLLIIKSLLLMTVSFLFILQ